MSAAVTLIDVSHASKQRRTSAEVASSPKSSDGEAQSSSPPTAPSDAAAADLLRSGVPSIVALPDPSTGDDRDYLVIPTNDSNASSTGRTVDIFEVQSLTGPSKYGSYFVGSRVVSDGTLRVATRVDPLFFVLAAVEAKLNKSSGDDAVKTGPRWQPLDQILADVPPCVRDALRNASSNSALTTDEIIDKQMRNLFHMTDQYGDDLILYKFDEKKAAEWLRAKHTRGLDAAKAGILSTKLREEVEKSEAAKLGGGGGAFSSTFNTGDEEEDGDSKAVVTQSPSCSQGSTSSSASSPTSAAGEVAMLCKEDETKARIAALQLVCEYLSDGWRNKLIEELTMTEEDLLGPTRGTKRKATDDNANGDADADGEEAKPASKWDSGNDAADKLQQIARGVDGCGGAAGTATAVMMDDKEREKAKKKEEKMNAKSMGLKKLAKVNTKGMKSLDSFFGGAKKKKKVQ